MENILSADGSAYLSEQSNPFKPTGRKINSAGLHSYSSLSTAGIFAEQNSTRHSGTRMALVVSATGERTLYPVDSNGDPIYENNPPAKHKESSDLDQFSEEMVKNTSLKEHRKAKRQRMATIILTPRNRYRRKHETSTKCVSAQTDHSITGFNVPECDEEPRKCSVASSTECFGERSFSNKGLAQIDRFLARFIPENIRFITSFMTMVVLIFWITSIILDVDVLSDFFRIAWNYLSAFQWDYRRKQPQNNAEKFLEWLTNVFE